MMKRRSFLVFLLLSGVAQASVAQKKFVFRIKTKSGNIVGNISIQSKDIEAAKNKLNKRYPNCEILNVETK
jgi:hypothetical protein